MLGSHVKVLLLAVLFVSVGCGDAGLSGDATDGAGTGQSETEGAAELSGSACAAGQLECGGVCASVDHVANCGGCGVACGTGQSCESATCQCDVGLSACEAGCAAVSADALNCGGCGTACGEDELCSAGTCISSAEGCPAGQEACGGACVETTSSQFHCGGCGGACDAGQVCEGGTCVAGQVGTGGTAGTGGTNAGSGGSPATGGAAPVGDGLAAEYPCDGSTAGYDYVVDGSGNSHTVNGSGSYSYEDAILNALGNGDRSVLVLSSGDVGSAAQLRIFSNTVFNACGTINVIDNGGSGDRAPAYARGASGIDIPHFNLTGVASYGMFFREVNDLHLGEIDIIGTAGIGIRIDNNPSSNCWGRCNRLTNVAMDNVYVANTGGHGVETYGVDGLTIGTIIARNVANAGLLLNATINATVGSVDAEDVATGNGYAAFRVANEAGKIGDLWPAGNIHVGTVRARRGGRGIFCVSDSGGTTIDNIDIADTGNNTMLLENCHNFTVAANSGTVDGGGGILITQRADEHTPSSNVTIQNLTANGVSIDGRCGGTDNLICNIRGGASVTGCSGTVQASCP